MHELLVATEELIFTAEDARAFEDSKNPYCPICINTETNCDFYPLPKCNHFLHRQCLMKLLGVNPDSEYEVYIERTFSCPTCREENFIDSL